MKFIYNLFIPPLISKCYFDLLFLYSASLNNLYLRCSFVFLCFIRYVLKRSEKYQTAEAQSFSAIVRDYDLWNPGTFSNHTEWISTLTSKIIDSGVIQNEVFQCLSQMCKVHVSNYFITITKL
jgi:hypothetical protein